MEMQERPPYVRFEVRAEEDRNASIEAGHYVARDVEYALITPPGSKDCVERLAAEWLAQIKNQAHEGRYPLAWSEHFHAVYRAWKENNAIPENGTPIRGWQLLSPAQAEQVLAGNIRTVEDLASANEEALRRIGMGARDMHNKARAWLQSAQDSGKLAAESAALQMENEQLKGRVAALEARLEQMAEKQPRKKAANE